METYYIEVGSEVILNSGGPRMTVEDIVMDEDDTGGGIVSCVWFQDEGEPYGPLASYRGHPFSAKFRSESLSLLADEDETD
jgi:uncharacterized protein YodC (DUF2158 family)